MWNELLDGLNRVSWAPNWYEALLNTPHGQEPKSVSPTWEQRQEAITAPFEAWRADPTEAAMAFGPGAMGALWKPTQKLLKELEPDLFKRLTSKELTMLEQLTEKIPSIRNSPIRGKKTTTEPSWYAGDPGLDAEFIPPKDFIKGIFPGDIQISWPGFTNHPELQANRSPALLYLHEAGGHGLTGTGYDLGAWAGHRRWPDSVGTPAAEGFAEGISHGALNQYNKRVVAPYWHNFKGSYYEPLYNKAGQLGVDVGADLRKGTLPNQLSIINELIRLMKGYQE